MVFEDLYLDLYLEKVSVALLGPHMKFEKKIKR